MYREGGWADERAGVGVYSGGGEEEKSCYNFWKYHTGFSTSLKSLVMKGLDETRLKTFSFTPLGSGSKICFAVYCLSVRSSQRRTYKKIDRYFGIGHGFQMERSYRPFLIQSQWSSKELHVTTLLENYSLISTTCWKRKNYFVYIIYTLDP